ncbi:MAG: PDZ domain-containing protein [Candidatus Hydrogenedens sp.]|nr:PDZ domain-containing protein [Candidatus Hydrogenedens sp.]
MYRATVTWAAVFVAAAAALPALAEPSPVLREIEESFIELHDNVGPSVVNIEVRGNAEPEAGAQEMFRFFGIPTPDNPAPVQPRAQATGSGFVFDNDGHIITNNHVVAEADTISVRFYDGSEYDAEVVGTDPDTDIAVIKIKDGANLKPVKFGNSDTVRVGQFAIAIGSPRQLEGTVSFGHISALGREDLHGLRAQGLRFQNLIQTDAAINLGNSGGPLCNIDGEVIGMNTAIVWGANSIGFAIPSNVVQEVVPQLISNGKVVRGFLGVGIDDVGQYADAVGLKGRNGAFVKEVRPGTPAEAAELQTYDVILKVGDKTVRSASDLVRLIAAYSPGAKVMLEVWRDGKSIEVEVELAEWQAEGAVTASASKDDVLGMQLRALTPEMVQRLGLEESTEGVLISNVEPGSPAEIGNLLPGDIIIEAGQKPVTSPEEFKKIVEREAGPGKSLLIRFIRGSGDPDITVVRVPAE